MAEIGIPASLLERYFSAYGNKSPLENAITPERVQAATEKFLAAQQAQAEQKLLQANIPEGAGNIPIKSFAQLMELKRLEQDREQKAEAMRVKQDVAMQAADNENKLLNNAAMANPEFKAALMKARPDMFPPVPGQIPFMSPPMIPKGGAKAFIAQVGAAKKAADKKPLDDLKQEGVRLSNAIKAEKLKGGGSWKERVSSGTVTGGGAPSDTKVVAGKTFRRVNGSWVQQ